MYTSVSNDLDYHESSLEIPRKNHFLVCKLRTGQFSPWDAVASRTCNWTPVSFPHLYHGVD